MIQVGSVDGLMESQCWEGELPQPGAGPLRGNEEVLETLVILLLASRLFIERMISPSPPPPRKGNFPKDPMLGKDKARASQSQRELDFIFRKDNSFSSDSLSGQQGLEGNG